eukprot:364511-Chlamydomonas_euryale.AAC.5
MAIMSQSACVVCGCVVRECVAVQCAHMETCCRRHVRLSLIMLRWPNNPAATAVLAGTVRLAEQSGCHSCTGWNSQAGCSKLNCAASLTCGLARM